MIEIGKNYVVECPFIYCGYSHCYDDGPRTKLGWKPGVRWESCGPDDSEAVADAVGHVMYDIVDIHRLPRPYPSRVFFVRNWVDPDGRRFGKNSLRIMTVEALNRRVRGYIAAGMDVAGNYSVRSLTEGERQALLEAA